MSLYIFTWVCSLSVFLSLYIYNYIYKYNCLLPTAHCADTRRLVFYIPHSLIWNGYTQQSMGIVNGIHLFMDGSFLVVFSFAYSRLVWIQEGSDESHQGDFLNCLVL